MRFAMNVDGYNIDVNYSYGYYRELSPLKFRLSCLLRGIKPPTISTACELGYGNGISLNIHSATSNAQWYGTDFNASQASFANEFANLSENGAKIYADSFLDFLHRKDLPDFDFIGFHGIYSWVDEKNRSYLREFIDKKLKAGGAVYASYNIVPGFVDLLPFRNVIKNYADFMQPKSKDSIGKLSGALDFFEKLTQADAAFISTNPQFKAEVDRMKNLDKPYLVHEFMNKSWEIMDFLQIHKELSESRIEFAFPSSFKSMWEHIVHKENQKAILDSIDNVCFKEYVRDLMNNTRFRRDYYIKGSQTLTPFEQKKLIEEMRVILVVPAQDVELSVNISACGFEHKFNLSKELYSLFLDIVSDHQPKTIAQIKKAANGKLDDIKQIIEVISVLDEKSALRYAQPEEVTNLAVEKTHKLNLEILQRSLTHDISHLGSALLGEGVQITRLHQLFLSSVLEGKKKDQEHIDYMWQTLKSQNQKIVHEGQIIQSDEENIKYIQTIVSEFQKTLPLLRNLKILKGI